MKVIRFLFPIFFFLFLLGSCGYLNIQQRDNAVLEGPTRGKNAAKNTIYNSCLLMGEVISKAEDDYPVSVIAHPLSFSEKNLLDYIILDRAGPFMMYVPEGRYLVYSVSDFNNDTFFEDYEVSGLYKNGEEISVKKGEIKKNITLVTNRQFKNQIELPRKLSLQDGVQTITHMGKNGQIRKIYDEMFSPKNAKVGLWKPSVFMKAYGANIYFAEPYDPEKIPVLFVHGAEGSPQNWVYFFTRLDRSRYQPWFFYYPSGIRLSLTSRILYENLIALQQKYHFQKIGLAAHSMGGLVTRAMLINPEFQNKIPFVKLYITFATPWSGFNSADMAVLYSNKKLPNWFDVGTRSAFGKRIMRAKLPDFVPYYLFYGKYDKIAKGKAIDERAFGEAKGHFGFECDHNTILSDRKVFDKYLEVLKKEL